MTTTLYISPEEVGSADYASAPSRDSRPVMSAVSDAWREWHLSGFAAKAHEAPDTLLMPESLWHDFVAEIRKFTYRADPEYSNCLIKYMGMDVVPTPDYITTEVRVR